MTTMWRAKLSLIALLVAILTLASTVVPFAAAEPGSGDSNNGVQDTMYDLEGSADDGDRFQGSSGDSNNGGSGVGSGSGSDERSGRNCQLPPTGTFPEPADFEDQVLSEIQCHLACVELVMEQENSTLEISSDYEIWPMIGNSILERNCSIYQKVEECKQGCLTSSLQPSLRDGRCALQCSRSCNQSCSGMTECYTAGSSCTRKCSEGDCLEGCQLYKEEISQPGGALPPSPSSKPSLFAPHVAIGAGIYTIDPGNTPTDMDSDELSGRRPLTSFIVRVVHEATNRIAFYWLHSLDDVVNLGSFSCLDDVLVQYAAVNKYGRSTRWSSSAEIDVYGANGIPSPENPDLNTIRFVVRPDQRFGYWKHGVITVYWDRPSGFHYVQRYVVTLHPSSFACGRRQIIISVPRELTRADIMAGMPSQGPVDGCVYEISVASVAVSGMRVPPVRKVLYSVAVNNSIPIDFQCIRSWSDVSGTFQFQLNWTIPDAPHLHDAITKFHILLTFFSPAYPEIRDAAEILFDDEESKYYYFTRRVRFGTTGSYYKIKMDSRSSLYNQILVPKLKTCEFDALPPPPDPPTTVAINNDSVQFQSVDVDLGMGILTLDLEWNRVAGNISSYEVRLVELRPGAEDAREENVQEIFQPDQLKLSKESASLTIEVPSSTENGCLYVQVRSISAHGTISNWSTPQCVNLAGLVLPTVNTLTTTPTRNDGTPGDSGSTLVLPIEMLYIVLSVAGVVLVATVILAVFVCLACYQNRRVSKNTKLMRLAAQQSGYQKTISPATTPTKPSYQSPKLQFQGGNPVPSVSLKKSAEDWELHPCQIIVENKLGQGGFGDVYQGTIRGGVGIYKSNGPQIMRVAVKILRAASSLEEKRAFLDHIEQAKLVTNQLMTPRVVKMVGCVTLHEPHCLVTELPARGDLLTYLVKARKKILNPEIDEDSDAEYPMEPTASYSTLDAVVPKAAAAVMGEPFRGAAANQTVEPKDLLNFSIQIASGMEYLSAIGVVHGDLACRNMYLNENHEVKISDFGINIREKGKHRLYVKVGHARLPLRWMAPEAIAEGQLTVASDVWAFGVTLWEIITLGGFPYIDISNKDLLQCLMSGRRLKKPSNCATEIYDIMKQCWNGDKTDRPTFTILHETLQDYFTSDDLNNLVSLQNIDPQSTCYQPRKHQSIGAIGGERLERRPQGEDGLQSQQERRREVEGGTQTMTDGGTNSSANTSDAVRIYHFTNHVLPQILEDEAEETTEEQETSNIDTERRRRVEETGDGSSTNKPSRSEESDHGTMNSESTEGFVSGAATPTSIEEGQTEVLRLRSEMTTPDSGYNMSQS